MPETCINGQCRGDDDPRRVAGQAYLCRPCWGKLERHIAELPALWEDLEQQLAPQGSSPLSESVDGTRDPNIKLNHAVVEARGRIVASLASWSRVVCEDRGLSGPRDNQPSVTATWLTQHVDWLAHQPFVDEVAQEFAELHGKSRALAYPSGRRRIHVGPCIEQDCDGELRATIATVDDLLPSEIACSQCQAAYTSSEWLRLGRRIHGSAA